MILLLLILMASLAHGQERPTAWRYSAYALIAANTADAVVSLSLRHEPGLREANPLYGGSFGGHAATLKAVMVGADVFAQWLIIRKYPRAARWFVPINFAQAGVNGWAVYHNLSLKGSE